MADNEIVKALKSCKDSPSYERCSECPYVECTSKTGCLGELIEDTIDLINRQKAEIERLKDFNENLQTANTCLSNEILDIKSEAQKEFAERLKGKAFKYYAGGISYKISEADIDSLLKEMESESNG